VGIYRRPNTPFFTIQGTVDGEPYYERPKVRYAGYRKDPIEIRERETELQREAKNRALAKKEGRTLPSAAKADIATLERFYMERLAARAHKLDKGTIASYVANWKNLRRHLVSISDCDTRHKLELYVAKRYLEKIPNRDRLYSGDTIRREIKVLRAAWDEAADHGLMLPAKPKMPENFKDDEEAHPGLEGTLRSPELLLRFFAELKPDGEAHARARLMVKTGIRWGESNKLHLCSEFFDPEESNVLVKIVKLPKTVTKKKKVRYIGLDAESWAIWQKFIIRVDNPSRPGFRTKCNKRAYEGASKRIGLGPKLPITTRDLRTSFSTGAHDHGASKIEIDGVMGHLPDMGARYQKQHEGRLARVAEGALRYLCTAKACGPFCAHFVQSSNVVPLRRKADLA